MRRTKLYYLDWAPHSETKVGQAFTTSGAVPRGRETKFDYGINVSFGLVVKATSSALDSDEGRVIQEIPRTQLRHLESHAIKVLNVKRNRKGRKTLQWIILMGTFKQPTNTEYCGYFVMYYMKEIVEDKNLEFASKY
ncbi:hypothetical protein Prudu_001419 [Prunus dulcis]|uniref:Ubiquitin-like protease family profile domain-containing protein n=1 Tax=Prunus dulcis TaxID=3755 RepID=A0A4Y1QNN4_PRUDU|nr:hypothetical protein Prudu_001419 [Prunus dulcis]